MVCVCLLDREMSKICPSLCVVYPIRGENQSSQKCLSHSQDGDNDCDCCLAGPWPLSAQIWHLTLKHSNLRSVSGANNQQETNIYAGVRTITTVTPVSPCPILSCSCPRSSSQTINMRVSADPSYLPHLTDIFHGLPRHNLRYHQPHLHLHMKERGWDLHQWIASVSALWEVKIGFRTVPTLVKSQV